MIKLVEFGHLVNLYLIAEVTSLQVVEQNIAPHGRGTIFVLLILGAT